MKNLTSTQRNELIEQFVELQVDSMDLDTLIQIVSDNLTDYYDKCSDSELKDHIETTYDEELFDELVDNVTQQYAKLPNTFGGQS